jgi:hypothetical protein
MVQAVVNPLRRAGGATDSSQRLSGRAANAAQPSACDWA